MTDLSRAQPHFTCQLATYAVTPTASFYFSKLPPHEISKFISYHSTQMAVEKGASTYIDRPVAHEPTNVRRLGEMATPFDRHLVDVYAGHTLDGLAFFEEHGYFDVSDTANTVQMFRKNVGLTEFWDDYDSLDRLDPFERALVYPFGSKSKVRSSRMHSALHQTNFGCFALLDVDDAAVIEDELQEMERKDRLKVKSFELDDDDQAELENEVVCMKKAIEEIRIEKHYFQQLLIQTLFRKSSDAATVSPSDRYTTPDFVDLLPVKYPSQVAHLDLPPYCSNLFVLRKSIPLLRRSWSKRWCILDFQSFTLRLYKRSYWQRLRRELDLRQVTKIEMMGYDSFQLCLLSGNTLLMRSRHERVTASWVHLIRFGMEMVQGDMIK